MQSAFLPAPVLSPPSGRQRVRNGQCAVHCVRRRVRSSAELTSSAVERRTLLLGGVALLAGLARAPAAHAGSAGVQDYAKILGRGERARLDGELAALEESTGLRVRMFTIATGVSADREQFVAKGERDVVLVADTRGGNVMYTRVSEDVYKVLPRSFWIELPNRFGTQFYVRENGVDGAMFAAVRAIADCAAPNRRSICGAVPGVSEDQLRISVVSAAAAGAIFGAAARTGGKQFNAAFVLLYSPIWSIFLVSFGVGPVLSRLQGVAHMESALVVGAFLAVAAAIWFWVPIGLPPPSGTDI